MGKKRLKFVLFFTIVLLAGTVQNKLLNANQVNSEEGTEESSQYNVEQSSKTEENAADKITTEEKTSEEDVKEASVKESGIEEEQDIFKREGGENTDNEDNAQEPIEGEEEIELHNGIYYYLNAYLYQAKEEYLKAYVEFLTKALGANKEMWNLGELTEASVKASEAELYLAKAELTAAGNEKKYYNICMEETGTKLTDFDVENIKSVYDNAYYRENYPEKNYMKMVRYVTDFNNAAAYIEAKKIEKEAVGMNIKMKEALYQEGEISELELMQEKVLMKKAEYELAQYYVDMNLAYYELDRFLAD